MGKKEYSIKELCDIEYKDKKLVVPLGFVGNKKCIYINLKNMSGLFIAGATGTGKSVFIDDIVVSLMYKNKPGEIKFIMLDPKKIELGEYDGINYLIGKKSCSTTKRGYKFLIDLLKLLEFRIEELKKTNHRNISGYNRVEKEKWPHVFLVVDEGCDIIKMKDSFEVFSRILEFGECVGVHLIYATNSYLKDYVNSKFLDKFNYRVTFDLASEEQAEFIDIKGSSWLKGEGHAAIKSPSGRICKFKAPHVSNEEINDIVLKNKE